MARILVVDDERSLRGAVSLALERAGHEVASTGSAEEAAVALRDEPFDVVLTDVRLGSGSGMDVLRDAKRTAPGTEVVVMTAFGCIEDAVEAMQLGAHNYVTKPFESAELKALVDRALEHRRLASRLEGSRPAGPDPFAAIVGHSRVMKEMLELVRKTAATDSTALITGETGTGKELIGRAIHHASARRDRVFCAVNSAAFPESLLESELFGHRKGAFTGATNNKKGLFEHADRGTVFLDEVAEMPVSMQAKLLRFLQTGEVRPVGSEQTRCVDVRLVTATNKELEREVEEGRFREDLYYRLAVIPIHVPPLRARGEDVPLLASHFLRRFAERLAKPVRAIDPAALDLLVGYAWPGNVRELENCIERAVALCAGASVETRDLPGRIRERTPSAEPAELESLEMVERIHILNTLEKVGWNRKKAAEVLRISTTTLWRRLKEFGIDGAPQRGGGSAGIASG